MLAGKRIIVGVTGSIAAYTAAILVRLLVKAGAEVRVLMTPLALSLIHIFWIKLLKEVPDEEWNIWEMWHMMVCLLYTSFNSRFGVHKLWIGCRQLADKLLINPADCL